MIENYGAFLSGLCWLGAMVQYVWQGNWRMTIVAVCYFLATMALIGAK